MQPRSSHVGRLAAEKSIGLPFSRDPREKKSCGKKGNANLRQHVVGERGEGKTSLLEQEPRERALDRKVGYYRKKREKAKVHQGK